jgi:hypothetical protein
MTIPTTHELKQIHADMMVLRNKEVSGIQLSKDEQSRMEQLVSERDALLANTLFHTY